MDALTQYLESHQEQFLEDLKAVLRIPSVSTEPQYKEDMLRCARHVADDFKKAGMTRVEIVPTAGHPVVYAEWLGAPGKPTALLYGHYDVQPVDPLELWQTPPFEPTIRDGKLYARGACDDKGQVYMHVAAIQAHMKVNGKLPINLKCVIEGEEEAGSDNLEKFLRDRRQQLDADVIVVSDTGMLAADQPALCYGLRGLLYTQIDVTGPARDLHSGEFGGAVQNPAQRPVRDHRRAQGRRRAHHGAGLLRPGEAADAGRARRRSGGCRSTRRASSTRPARRWRSARRATRRSSASGCARPAT